MVIIMGKKKIIDKEDIAIMEKKLVVIEKEDKEDISIMRKRKLVTLQKDKGVKEEITDSVSAVAGISGEDAETLEWIPAYYCEMWILKSHHATDEFIHEVTQEIYKKKGWFQKRLKYVGDIKQVLRYSLEEIRSSTLRGKMQDLIDRERFECKLPNNHIRFAGVKMDAKTGAELKNQGCLGKTIAEKISKSLYYINESGATIRYILVREHEKALFVKDGKIITTLDAGRYDIKSKTMDYEIIEIYYVDTGNITTRWGTYTMLTDGAGTRSATQVKLRLNGSLILRINNISNFLTNIVKNQAEYYEGNIENYVKDKIIEIVNSEMSKAVPLNIYQNAEDVMRVVKLRSNEFLMDAGIEIVNLAVSSCKFDEDTEEIFRKRLEKIKVAGAESDAQFDRKMDELKKLKELGIDINEYIKREQKITMNSKITSPSTDGRTIICPSCKKLAGTGKFCQNCGYHQPIICPSCGELAGTGNFCQKCGAPLN
jgi:membrane protease subunit (stomatin/prohibitin family)